jgi:hypothetical protein
VLPGGADLGSNGFRESYERVKQSTLPRTRRRKSEVPPLRNESSRPPRRFGDVLEFGVSTLLLTLLAGCPEGAGLSVGVHDAGVMAPASMPTTMPPSDGADGPTPVDAAAPLGPDARSSPQACAGAAALTCPAGQYCKLKVGECLTKPPAVGECSRPAEACAAHADPVCGCDDKTYSNDCVAAQASVSVQAKGACPMTGTTR